MDQDRPQLEETAQTHPSLSALLQKASTVLGILISGIALVAIVAGIVGVVVIVCKLAASGRIPSNSNPLDTIFASRLMVAVSRITILFIGLYLIITVLVLLGRGQFLSEVGPFKFSGAVRKSSAVNEELSVALNEALDENARLRDEVLDLRARLEGTSEYLGSVLEESDKPPDNEGDENGNDTRRN